MKAVILAAGRGKRMKHLTLATPKPFLCVGGKPILEHILSALPHEVSDVIMVIGYQGAIIRNHFGDSFDGKKISYIVQKELTGTWTALLLTKQLLEERERFVLIYGDELPTKEQVKECLAYDYSLLCREMSNPSQSGIVDISEDGIVTGIIEKPENPLSNMVAAGMMVIDADIFSCNAQRHANGEYYLAPALNSFLKTHTLHAVFGIKDVAFSYPEDIAKFAKHTIIKPRKK